MKKRIIYWFILGAILAIVVFITVWCSFFYLYGQSDDAGWNIVSLFLYSVLFFIPISIALTIIEIVLIVNEKHKVFDIIVVCCIVATSITGLLLSFLLQ
ncbi:MAG: hypothetical protein J5691_06615 [Bacilli bacterium]|nr:hypothetical protein [Bacilli bacterium]